MSSDAPVIPQATGGGAASSPAAADLESGEMTHKDKGNALFKAAKYAKAVDMYTLALEQAPTVALYGNRAFCHIKLENFGSAILDANEALKLDPRYVKAYYRRGTALLSLGKLKNAQACFKRVLEIKPKSKDAKEKLAACNRMIRARAFARALETPGTKPLWETLDLDAVEVSDSYAGAPAPPTRAVSSPTRSGPGSPGSSSSSDAAAGGDTLQLQLTHEYVLELMAAFKDQKQLHWKYVGQIVVAMIRLLKELPSVIRCGLSPEGAAAPGGGGTNSDDDDNEDGASKKSERRITICGDTHGQFFDLCNIFELNGYPSPSNPYLFNGDFVDRGSFSLENVLTLFCWKLLYPDSVHLMRGNHETVNMNKMYGFEGEVKAKANDKVMQLFTECFRWLPLAAVVDDAVFVTHGGLLSQDGVKVEELAKIDRNREPPESGPMCDLLWADPAPFPGRHPSKRGCGLTFGPDITQRFLDDNNLKLLVRSHEVKMQGFLVEHEGKCITVFSAPNYCDQMGNRGAMMILRPDLDVSFKQFTAVPHPDVKPMAYVQSNMFGL